ncbi:hypothetical protein PLANPX_1301 [Lacipirellula parvula]|uniref:Uncharacterized protein n=1 Tax=Lacipirellula parvula TaxID=2650471 RepID=A0A5K7XFC3_9BACT|nr:hypothetical protein PLANPX_1301 [Lacipirellula parvula]
MGRQAIPLGFRDAGRRVSRDRQYQGSEQVICSFGYTVTAAISGRSHFNESKRLAGIFPLRIPPFQ